MKLSIPVMISGAILLLLPRFILYADDSLTVKSRYISETEENMGLVFDFAEMQGGFLFEHQGPEDYRFTGGFAFSYLKAGTLSLRGPLQELLSPSSASPSGDIFSCIPGASLLRSWDSSSRVSAVLTAPGKAMFSVTSGKDGLPEAGAEFTVSPVPGISVAAAAAYGTLTPGESDDWFLSRGVPPSGEILQTGLRAEAGGRRFKLSLFAAASLHRILPPGYYLRAVAVGTTRIVETGLRYSWISKNYRTLRHPWPSFHYNAAYDVLFFPEFRIRPTFGIRGEMEQAEAGLPVAADRSLSGRLGCNIDFMDWSADFSRHINLEMEEGEWAGDEIVSMRIFSPDLLSLPVLKLRLETEVDWLIAPQSWSTLLNARAAMVFAVSPLTFSFGVSRNCEQETGEVPESPETTISGGAGWQTPDFRLDAEMEYSDGFYSFSIKGAKKFEISLINIKNS